MKRLLNILLILIVVTCPIRCYVSGCCCAPSALQQEQESCCCSNGNGNQDSPNQPMPDLPCKKGQCFCSGAMLPDLFEVDFDTEWEFLTPVATELSFHPIECSVPNCRGPDWVSDPLQFSTTNIGRLIRGLHCSLII